MQLRAWRGKRRGAVHAIFKWHSENEWNKIENPEEMRLPKQNTIQNKCTVAAKVVHGAKNTIYTNSKDDNAQRNSENGNTTMGGTNFVSISSPYIYEYMYV
ncbi:unnamed protein product [Ceratitis capitata]|uniref:(Mediterranean fruit fly) hypothetical protein n=1 Tax=Ceratitis capitata TaxID=7213 RepID=A0A811U9L8_CERCA|nr:unnamed protein product [Ceratitis capitata]